MKNDRRQQQRKIPPALAFIQVEKDEGGRVVNISESGLCFEVFSTIRVTEAVHFWFTFNLSDRIEALGRLVWIDATKRIGGLTFTRLSQTAHKQIQFWLGKMPFSEPPVVRDVPSQAPEIPRANAPVFSPDSAYASVPSQAPEVRRANAPLVVPDTVYVSVPSQTPQICSTQAPLVLADAAYASVPSQAPEVRRANAPLPSPNTARASLLPPPPRTETARASAPPPPPRVETFAAPLPAPKFDLSEKSVRQLTTGGILGYTPESPSEAHLVPFDRHRSAARAQFLRGLLVGVGISAAVAIPIFMSTGSGQSRATAQQTQTRTISPDPAISSGPQIANSSPQPAPAAYSPIAKSHDSRTKPSSRTSRDSDIFGGADPSPSPSRKPGSSVSPSYDLNAPAAADAKRPSKSLGSPKQLWAAVQAGNTNAAVILADHYIHGDGVPMNCDQARVLLLVASEKNNKAAIQKLRDLDKTGCPQTAPTPPPSQ